MGVLGWLRFENVICMIDEWNGNYFQVMSCPTFLLILACPASFSFQNYTAPLFSALFKTGRSGVRAVGFADLVYVQSRAWSTSAPLEAPTFHNLSISHFPLPNEALVISRNGNPMKTLAWNLRSKVSVLESVRFLSYWLYKEDVFCHQCVAACLLCISASDNSH
jgi:hypothetical protein